MQRNTAPGFIRLDPKIPNDVILKGKGREKVKPL